MLIDEIEDMKKQLAERGEEKEEEEQPEKVVEEPVEEEKVEESPKEEEKPAEPVKEEPKEEEKPDNAAFARLRMEAAANKRRAEELEARLKAKETPVDDDAPSETDNILAEVVHAHRVTQAEKEFTMLEQNFRRGNPEYDSVSAQYAQALAASIRLENPRLSPVEIAEKTKQKILTKAANFMNQGYTDPIEAMYLEAKELGFKEIKEPVLNVDPVATQYAKAMKPDMAKLAANRAKSGGLAAASGKSESILTKQAAADLTVAEWQKLPADEKRRLLYS